MHDFEPIRPREDVAPEFGVGVSPAFAAQYCRRCGDVAENHPRTTSTPFASLRVAAPGSRRFLTQLQARNRIKMQKDSQGEAYGRPVEQDVNFEAGADAGIQLNKSEHPHGYAWTDGLPGESRGTELGTPGGDLGTPTDFWRLTAPWGRVRPGQPGTATPYVLGHRSLDVDRLVHDHGFGVRYDGGPHGRADPTGAYLTHIVVPHGSHPVVGIQEDRDAYHKVHELAHALTLPEIKRIYGEGHRVGRLGTISLRDAQRTLHWEMLAARKQRTLLEELGVHITDADFNREANTIAADTVHRLVTGTRRNPQAEGFQAHDFEVPLNVGQQVLAEEARRLGLRSMNDVRAQS